MIDLTNKPAGATHYGIADSGDIAWYFISGDVYRFYDDKAKDWSALCSMPAVYKLEKIDDWTIYNNDKPLSELSDEQVGAILRHGIEKGVIEVRVDKWKWYDNLILTGWHTALAYRAKQKTERELFIETATDCYREDRGHSKDQIACVAYMMFDSGNFSRKAPKVGE